MGCTANEKVGERACLHRTNSDLKQARLQKQETQLLRRESSKGR